MNPHDPAIERIMLSHIQYKEIRIPACKTVITPML